MVLFRHKHVANPAPFRIWRALCSTRGMKKQAPLIEGLGVIGDRNTIALVTKEGDICWHCPEQFDSAPWFSNLLDSKKGGGWTLLPDNPLNFHERRYFNQSAILKTIFKGKKSDLELVDFMPIDSDFKGIVRKIKNNGVKGHFKVKFAPDFSREKVSLQKGPNDNCVVINNKYYFYSSNHIQMEEDGSLKINFDKTRESWQFFAYQPYRVGNEDVKNAMNRTLHHWERLSSCHSYEGPYKTYVDSSFRTLRLLTKEGSGAIIAAGTTSLPEVVKGERNYDYRYVWLRDTAMIVSALVRAGDKSDAAERFLDFICDTHHKNENALMYPFFTLEKGKAGKEIVIDKYRGYANSSPVVIGNGANEQLQLDANANVLLAAKLIYQKDNNRKDNKRPHWETIEKIANFLAKNWSKKDHGIWEESKKLNYTTSKVIVACALEYIAQHSEDKKQKEFWQNISKDIRKFIEENCVSEKGFYKLAQEVDEVDVSAALYPTWGFVDAFDPKIKQTIKELEKKFQEKNLFRRNLVCFDSHKEGVFLAGSIWMAQYHVMEKNHARFKEIIEAVLAYSNDLGFFAEEGDVKNKMMLGNFPQTFVHASLIGAIIDYKNSLG